MTEGFPSYPTPMPPARRRRSGWIVLALVIVVIGGASFAWWQNARAVIPDAASSSIAITDSSARAPVGERVQVRVINSTTTRGLARRATFLLRDFGYDVVDFDTDSRRRRDRTLIQVHTGKSEVGERIRRVLGTGEIASLPDSLRYLDLTILIGNDWKPPTQPLRP